jgi:hypothetical protein
VGLKVPKYATCSGLRAAHRSAATYSQSLTLRSKSEAALHAIVLWNKFGILAAVETFQILACAISGTNFASQFEAALKNHL